MLGAKDQTQSELKANANDFVTIADIKSQNMIRKSLLQVFPDALIISEEDSEHERQQLFASDFTGFVLDPIDGTYNFKRDMRESAISIGYVEKGDSVAGVIFDPYRDELYEAGAKVLTLSGHEARFTDDRLLFGTPAIVDQLLEIFAKLPLALLT